ncbi:glycosyltransferase family 4 protein [Arachidicoccus terrestris]|uniref:glycosyltransferase family 4 protein n=1 Tax=Arachidicoccus terrestris TaxID=2875539 RepID=UPI001CC47EF8|nr:glycosyltransferase family 4 protein [Arachidicoccus terrestris]UAY55456.1 glycosyltransferase family 4 protein [Arachidicoccus terrestris]
MKKILYLTFYFEPDLSAGSFRNTSLVKEIANQSIGDVEIDVFTTLPNRYSSFQAAAKLEEHINNLSIYRIRIPKHQNGMKDQIYSFKRYFTDVQSKIKGKSYDLVVASSSRLFTAYLGYKIAVKNKLPLYLDIRDIFIDTMEDVLKNPFIKIGTIPLLRIIENKVFSYATHINLISGGFKDYFKKFKGPVFSTYSNGIDDLFLDLPRTNEVDIPNRTKVITYAGNIGEGQGLHKIIPQAAKKLGNDFLFQIIGDGGAKYKLVDKVEELGVKNVDLRNPVNRQQLIEIYNNSDFLFIHLNDYEAFKKVLPSKVFELGAYDKPLIAGVAGFANRFIEENISNKILFLPGQVDEMVNQLKAYEYKNQYREEFINKYKRSTINTKLAQSILSYIK